MTLLSLLPGITVIGATIDGDDAVRQALKLRPDVVLMDLIMPRCNGVEATQRLRRLRPAAAVVVLTTYSDDAWVFAALQAGAREVLAHLVAGESNEEIAAALFVSEATVKTHVHHLPGKTGLRDRSQLVGYAFRNGLAGRD